MNSTGEREREADRVERTYAGYRRSRRKRRAWDSGNAGNRAIREELLAALLEEAEPELASGGPVIDVGCGTGFWLERLQTAGTPPDRLTGIDVAPKRVAAAAARIPEATIREADARALPFDDGGFALVLMFTTLSSLAGQEDVRRALLEARRVLRTGGLLLCYEPRRPNPLNGRVRRIRDQDFDAAGITPRRERRLTLLPPLARRLGSRTAVLYPHLARAELLRTHRLVAYRNNRRV